MFRPVMSNSANPRALAYLVVAICLVLPALSFPVRKKIYLVRNLKTVDEKDFFIGVEITALDASTDIAFAVYGVRSDIWERFHRKFIPSDVAIEEVAIDKVPAIGLFSIIGSYPEVYSDVLPILLSKSSPKKVSEELSVDLFKTLTPEAKAKISPENLAELAKLYGQ